MTCSNHSCSGSWSTCNRCSSCGCTASCCSPCPPASRPCACPCCSSHTNCSCGCCKPCEGGCTPGGSGGCNNGNQNCNGGCVYSQLHVTIPACGVCRICCAGIIINSVNTALIGGRYVTSISYTATMDYMDRCGCRRTATTTQTTQVYLPESCTRFTNVCARVVRRTAVTHYCGAGICAVLQVCCR